MRRLFCVFLVGLVSLAAVAQAGYKLKTRTAAEMASEQRRAVAAWCRADYDGVRLAEATWQKQMRPLTNLKRFSDFPSILIVSRYQFEPQQNISTAVNVTYAVTGRYDLGFGYQASAGSDSVTFRVEDKGGDILITDPGTDIPHVSKAAAIRWLKERLESPGNPNEKVQIKEALKTLEPAPAQPEAK